MAARYPRAGLIRISDQLLLESMVQILAGKDHVGLLFAGMGHDTVDRLVLKLRAELDGKPEPGSAAIYQFPAV